VIGKSVLHYSEDNPKEDFFHVRTVSIKREHCAAGNGWESTLIQLDIAEDH
jgi:hypothetical protein